MQRNVSDSLSVFFVEPRLLCCLLSLLLKGEIEAVALQSSLLPVSNQAMDKGFLLLS